MRDPKDSDFQEKALEFGREIFNYVTRSSHGDLWIQVVTIVILVCLALIVGAVFFKALAKALEELAKFLDAYKNSSFNIVLNIQKKKVIRKRKQFCSVLDADLAYIAKAESWNDQYFTDLEAEVETEGGFYASALDRLRKRRSFGLRRVSSLMRAIETSTERAVLLVGDPGSGKSVALRHFAKQMAEKGKISNNSRAVIPLYLNLRELEVSPGSEVNADLIKQFVLENIRRGDADTSAYVQDNWEINKENGTWMFLFDSFDEIPNVLHAASGSVAVREYSKAIRQFLDGMGECRSILASREYKGPEALPWKKFKILPLNKDRQRKLVDNSFLEDSKRNLVHQHLATERSTLGNNPLFLTLLCRFVKDLGAQPANDYQLLTSHLGRLANREPDYIFKRYNLTGDTLMAGAQKLAVLFASNPKLSLAPRLDEIFAALPENNLSMEGLQNLVSALVDVKIGRNDVATAKQGDRRFAFSHRRYQETLFANFIAANPNYIAPIDLLLKPEWRDYAVTLLQSQTVDSIRDMLAVATQLLDATSRTQAKTINKYLPERDIGFYDWQDNSVAAVLLILQEGMARRLDDVPNDLSNAIFNLLAPRWLGGDDLDRYMVIKLGGLLPQDTLVDYLKTALGDGSPDMAAMAFKQCVFLRTTSDEINKLICEKLARETLCADKLIKKLQLEAIAARLPTSVGAMFVFKRCVRLRSILAKLCMVGWVLMLPNYIFMRLLAMTPVSKGVKERLARISPRFVYRGGIEWIMATTLPLVFLLANEVIVRYVPRKPIKHSGLFEVLKNIGDSIYFRPVLFLYIGALMFLIGCYRLRDEGAPVRFHSMFTSKRFKSFALDLLPLCIALVVLICLAFVPLGIGYSVKILAQLIGYEIVVSSVYAEIGLPITFGIILFAAVVAMSHSALQQRARLKRFRELKNCSQDDGFVLLQARQYDDAESWLAVNGEFLTGSAEQVRSISAIVRKIPEISQDHVARQFPLMRSKIDNEKYYVLGDRIAVRAIALETI